MSLTREPHWKPLAAASPFTAGIEGPVLGHGPALLLMMEANDG
jgi:hypothetical protein